MTEKQKKLVKEFSENFGKKGFTKTIEQMMIDAGYEESTAKQQSATLVGIREELKPIVEQLEAKRQIAINKISDEKLDDTKARDLAYIVDILTKNIQLLSGKDTEIIQHYIWDKYENKTNDNLPTENLDSETQRKQSEVEGGCRS